MPRFIAKLGEDEYVDWSTVVDAPVTDIFTRAQMAAYMLREYGEVHANQIEARLERADANGHTALWGNCQRRSVEDMLVPNRAGEGEVSISLDEIRKAYRRSDA